MGSTGAISFSNGNAFFSNLIFSNGGLGIDLSASFDGTKGDGVTPNDEGDVDGVLEDGGLTGANFLQNFPVLTSAISGGGVTIVEGSLNSAAAVTFRLEFFANETADPTGLGEGQTFLGSTEVTTDDDGNASFRVTLPVAVPVGNLITSTATDPTILPDIVFAESLGSTSEFSAAIPIVAPPTGPELYVTQFAAVGIVTGEPPTADAGGPYTIDEGDSVSLDASGSSDPDGDSLNFTWDINGDGVFGDATGEQPTLTWSELHALGIDDDGSFTVTLRVDDGNDGVDEATATLTVNNTVPTVVVGGAESVDEGSVLQTFNFCFS